MQQHQSPPPPPPQQQHPPPPASHVLEIEVNAESERAATEAIRAVAEEYERGCVAAFEALQQEMQAARDRYYAGIGRLAVRRDLEMRRIAGRFSMREEQRAIVSLLASSVVQEAPSFEIEAPLHTPAQPAKVKVVSSAFKEPQAVAWSDASGVIADAPYEEHDDGDDGGGGGVGSPYSPLVFSPVLPQQLPQTTPKTIIAPVTPDAVTSPPSQRPDFEHMSVEELKRRYDEFGLQHAKEGVMRKKLAELWEKMHPHVATDTERVAAMIQAREVPPEDYLTPCRPAPKVPKGGAVAAAPVVIAVPDDDAGKEQEDEGSDKGKGNMDEEQEPRVPVDATLDAQIVAFIRKSSYFQRMVLFEPVPVLQLKEDLLAAGIRVSKPALCNFLDRKGVIFHDPQSKWK